MLRINLIWLKRASKRWELNSDRVGIMTKQQEEEIAAELLEIELDLTVPDGWCHKCGRITNSKDTQ